MECDDTKSLFGMALCVADSRKRDRFDLVGNFLDRNPLEDFVVRGRELLDSVIVDAFVGERDDCRVAVLRGDQSSLVGAPWRSAAVRMLSWKKALRATASSWKASIGR